MTHNRDYRIALAVGIVVTVLMLLAVLWFLFLRPPTPPLAPITRAPTLTATLTLTATATYAPTITPPPSLTPTPTHTDPTISPPTVIHDGTLTPTPTPTNSPSITPSPTLFIPAGRNKTPIVLPVTGLSAAQVWILTHRR